jgi:hypothetical protein
VVIAMLMRMLMLALIDAGSICPSHIIRRVAGRGP